jgi:hypothetical protein
METGNQARPRCYWMVRFRHVSTTIRSSKVPVATLVAASGAYVKPGTTGSIHQGVTPTAMAPKTANPDVLRLWWGFPLCIHLSLHEKSGCRCFVQVETPKCKLHCQELFNILFSMAVEFRECSVGSWHENTLSCCHVGVNSAAAFDRIRDKTVESQVNFVLDHGTKGFARDQRLCPVSARKCGLPFPHKKEST